MQTNTQIVLQLAFLALVADPLLLPAYRAWRRADQRLAGFLNRIF